MSNNESKKVSGKSLWAGLIVLGVGVILLLNGMNLDLFPGWIFHWPAILIIVGIIAGIKSNFKNPGWLILIIVGSVFMLNELHIFATVDLWKFGPAFGVIVVGLFIIIRALSPRSSHHVNESHRWNRWHRRFDPYKDTDSSGNPIESGNSADFAQASGEDWFDVVNIFGGSKRKIFSKRFKGGESANFFGGTHLDLTQADIEDKAVLDLVCVFGGVKLIVPSNWQIDFEITTIMGGMEDKRSESTIASTSGKRLVITGVCIFGGVEIKNFY